MVDANISISEMADLHGISRQTLIYYDSIGLFRPEWVDYNGYRYYSKHQIPFLREICFLKSLGVPLKEVVQHFQGRTPATEKTLLEEQRRHLTAEIARLNQLREYADQRIRIYEEAIDVETTHVTTPFVSHLEARSAVFAEYIQPINRENLHMTLMGLWRQVFREESVPSAGFGSIFRRASVEGGDPLDGAGSCIFVPTWSRPQRNLVHVPAGRYICMYKYGMPYEVSHIERLMQWIEANGYRLCGDIVDLCLLDTTFYGDDQKVDLCVLQAPVESEEPVEQTRESKKGEPA